MAQPSTESQPPRGQPRVVEGTVDGQPARITLDLVEMRIDHFDHFTAGYASGWSAGVDEGRRRADDEAGARHRRAVQVVHAMAEVPSHDDLEARRRTYRTWVGGE